MLTDIYRVPMIFMVLHAFLAALWNVAGVWLISQGQSPLGPTASLVGAVVLTVLAGAYIFTLKRGYEKSFLVLASIGALAGILTIYGALTKDPGLWPSEFWRVAGIAVNALAAIGFALAVKVFISSRENT